MNPEQPDQPGQDVTAQPANNPQDGKLDSVSHPGGYGGGC